MENLLLVVLEFQVDHLLLVRWEDQVVRQMVRGPLVEEEILVRQQVQWLNERDQRHQEVRDRK